MAKSKAFSTIKRVMFGAFVGGLSARSVSTADTANSHMSTGAMAGAIISGVSPVIGNKIAKAASRAAHKATKAPRVKGKIIWRRIRGRMVPIRSKK